MTGSMFVSISDDNRRCTKIYLSEKEAPGASNNIVQELGNQLVYECATNKLRHISVEATGPCPYSITATTSLKKILRVERGVTQNIKLSAGEIQLFVMHQSTKMSFKLLSLHEYGQIEIYLNRSDAVTIEKLASTKQVDIKKFQMKGQMKNRLVMLTDNPLFCVDCYYLVAVEAIKHTESSLYYGDEETLVPFTKKVVNDYLSHKGEKVMGTYFGGNIVKMELKVHSGHLQVNVSRENNFFVKNFTVNAKLQVEHYEFIQELEISLFKKLFELLNWSSTRI